MFCRPIQWLEGRSPHGARRPYSAAALSPSLIATIACQRPYLLVGSDLKPRHLWGYSVAVCGLEDVQKPSAECLGFGTPTSALTSNWLDPRGQAYGSERRPG